jgi:hypothetical protein
MPLDFQTKTITFLPTKGDPHGIVLPLTFNWASTVITRPKPVAMLSGFNLDFFNEERHLHQETIQLTVLEPTGNLGTQVDVQVRILLRDFTGNVDDFYEGWVSVTMIVERQ